MLLPNSWSIIKNYILTLFWVQSWGPLYAVLNLFLNLETRRSLIGLIESPVFELSAITIANLPGVEQVASDRALMAAYLSMFVPVISFSLIMTGKAYFPHLLRKLLVRRNQLLIPVRKRLQVVIIILAISHFIMTMLTTLPHITLIEIYPIVQECYRCKHPKVDSRY